MPRRKANLSEVTLRKESEWVIVRDVFSFRYVNFLGYRKGADDQPEIHPEEALHHAILEAIRSLVQNHQKDIEANLENALLDSFSGDSDELPRKAIKNKLKNWNRNLTNCWLWPERKSRLQTES